MRGKGLCEQRSQHLVRNVELKTIIEPPEGLRWQEVFFQTHASAAAEERQSSFHGVLVPRERLVPAQACENALVVAYHVFAPPYAPLHRRCQVSDCRGRRRLWSQAPQLWDCGPCARLTALVRPFPDRITLRTDSPLCFGPSIYATTSSCRPGPWRSAGWTPSRSSCAPGQEHRCTASTSRDCCVGCATCLGPIM